MKISFNFYSILCCALISFTQSAYATAQCTSMNDVFTSKNLNSYRVLQKTYFLKKCNDDDLCSTKRYVVGEDYLLAGYRNGNLCAAYIPETHEKPLAIGWIKINGNIKITDISDYEKILGAWFSNENPICKYIGFYIFDYNKNNKSIKMEGDLHSKVSSMLAFIGGDVFKINHDRYIVISGEKSYSIISNESKEELTYILKYDDETSPYIDVFNGKYHKHDSYKEEIK